MTCYHRRIAETAVYREKQLFGSQLLLRDFDAQDDASRYARNCTRCLKNAHSGDSFQIRFIQQRP
ncbi:MAG: hypothetical protein G5663_04410 [Serratia symbiotica]|nr:hypothetical protein [Serratia symbiotica]